MTGTVNVEKIKAYDDMNTKISNESFLKCASAMSTELFLACAYGNFARLIWLIRRYSDKVMKWDIVSTHCLAAACSGGHIGTARYLKVHFFPKDINERFRCINACENGTLLEYAVMPHLGHRDKNQKDILGLPKIGNVMALKVVKFLIGIGADVNLSTRLICRCIETGRNNVIFYVCTLPGIDMSKQVYDDFLVTDKVKKCPESFSQLAEWHGNTWAKKFFDKMKI